MVTRTLMTATASHRRTKFVDVRFGGELRQLLVGLVPLENNAHEVLQEALPRAHVEDLVAGEHHLEEEVGGDGLLVLLQDDDEELREREESTQSWTSEKVAHCKISATYYLIHRGTPLCARTSKIWLPATIISKRRSEECVA